MLIGQMTQGLIRQHADIRGASTRVRETWVPGRTVYGTRWAGASGAKLNIGGVKEGVPSSIKEDILWLD
jgi:hypothetical protein